MSASKVCAMLRHAECVFMVMHRKTKNVIAAANVNRLKVTCTNFHVFAHIKVAKKKKRMINTPKIWINNTVFMASAA